MTHFEARLGDLLKDLPAKPAKKPRRDPWHFRRIFASEAAYAAHKAAKAKAAKCR